MARHSDRSRIRAAKIEGAAMAVGDAVARLEPVELDDLRHRWPALWAAVRRLGEAVRRG